MSHRIGVGRGNRGSQRRHGISLADLALTPPVTTSYCLLLEDGFHLLLETGADCIAREDNPMVDSALLLEDGFGVLLEDDTRVLLEA